jgi:hypothetical protein
MKTLRISILALVPLFAATGFVSLRAQDMPVEGPVPTKTLITITSKGGAALDPAQLRLQLNRHDAPITSVVPVAPGTAQIAILIDDGLRGSVSLQLGDIKSFISQLPMGTKLFIGYMQNGTVRSEGGFTTDKEAAMQQLRIPISAPGISASPYFCLSEFVKHWPSDDTGARMVLMITNGVDPYNGSTSILNQDSPYVQTAQEDAERAGVAVYSIYYGDSGFRGGRGSFSGQSYLQQVAEATGGMAYNQGTIPPPSFTPYLNEFAHAIAESYTINFMAINTHDKRNTLTQLKLTTTQPGVKIHAPENVHPGMAQQ